MNPRTELEKKYPAADFSEYFRFLAEHSIERCDFTHEHHICPRKQFPEYEVGFPENIVILTTENHGTAHILLERAAPEIKAPYTAFLIAQRISASRAARLGGLKGGVNGGRETQRKGTGVFMPGVAAKGGRLGGPIGAHKRWHVNRNRTSLKCVLCKAQL